MTRRTMIATLSIGGLATAAKAKAAFPAAAGAGSIDLDRGAIDQWSALVGQRFSLAGSPGARLKLVAVEPLDSKGPRPRGVRRRGFAAIFEAGADSARLADSTCIIAADFGAPLPVFFGNGGLVAGKSHLIAIFN